MAFEAKVFDFTFKNTEAAAGGPNSDGSIPQYAVVCFDSGNAGGCRNAGSANAGAVIGINQSKGIVAATGAISANVQNGQDCLVRLEGISRAIVSAATGVGQPLSVQNSSGQVGPGSSTFAQGGLVGYGLEAGTTQGDIISILMQPGLQPALKALGTFASPLVENGVANTAQAHAHGLGYVPHIVLITGVQGTSGPVNLAAAPDATNVTTKSPVASATSIIYVA